MNRRHLFGEATGVTEFTFNVSGFPVPQPRAGQRSALINGVLRTWRYDPPQAKDWKRTVQSQVLDQLAGRLSTPFMGAVGLSLGFLLPRPKSLPKKVWAHMTKPDCDNLAKGVKDALRGILYFDDKQVNSLYVTKVYSQAPGVVIHVVFRDAVLGGENVQQRESEPEGLFRSSL